jgi:dihydroorotase
MQSITLTQADDWHLHLRDGDALKAVTPYTAAQFARAVIMPNLQPPITTVEQALAYRQRVLAAVPAGNPFNPLMTLYLTDSTSATEIKKAAAHEHIHAVKLYPAGATTNSEHGLSAIEKGYDAIAAMEEHGLPLLVHGEVTRKEVDVFDREARFVGELLEPLQQRFPKLKLVLEHITTGEGIDFVNSCGDNVGGTLTPQHLLLNRNALFQGGMRPHHYCLPILKRETHRVKLLAAATSGSKKFFLGTDSAPHAQDRKESACGCAGIFSAHAAIELYAEAFESVDALDKLEGFASFNGPDFYGLPRNTKQITLIKDEWSVPAHYGYGDDKLIPFRAGESMRWKLKED